MKIELLKPHTHAGKPCNPGDVIEVSRPVGHWLIETGTGKTTKKPLPPIDTKE